MRPIISWVSDLFCGNFMTSFSILRHNWRIVGSSLTRARQGNHNLLSIGRVWSSHNCYISNDSISRVGIRTNELENPASTINRSSSFRSSVSSRSSRSCMTTRCSQPLALRLIAHGRHLRRNLPHPRPTNLLNLKDSSRASLQVNSYSVATSLSSSAIIPICVDT